jgi:predicted O-methyltransferase YrrM
VITDADVEGYLRASRRAPDGVLAEMEEHGRRDRIPIVMPETGATLTVLTRACAARRVVEVGTAIGVSTLHIARALPPDGTIVSFEVDEERHRAAGDYLRRAGVGDRVELHLRDAGEGLAELEPGSFDMAFLDGLKGDYPRHLDLALALLRPGGIVAVDNALLSGSVARGTSDGNWSDEQIEEMRRFNDRVLQDPSFDAALLPVGDGLLVAVTAR